MGIRRESIFCLPSVCANTHWGTPSRDSVFSVSEYFGTYPLWALDGPKRLGPERRFTNLLEPSKSVAKLVTVSDVETTINKRLT